MSRMSRRCQPCHSPALSVALLVLAPIAAAASEAEAALERLAEPGVEESVLVGRVARLSGALNEASSTVDFVTTVSEEPPFARRQEARKLLKAFERGGEALRAVGIDVPRKVQPIRVIRVRLPGGSPSVVSNAAGDVVLVREAPARETGALPGLPERPDGPPTVRDARRASEALRLELITRATRGRIDQGPGSFPHAIANHLARTAGVPAEPRWLREGIVAWLAERAFPREDPPHVCGTFRFAEDARLDELLAPDTEITSTTLHLFASAARRLLVDDEGDGAKLLAIMGDRDRFAARLEAERGLTPRALLKAGRRGLVARDALSCDESGHRQCPLCRGTSEIDLACPDCEGTGLALCPSCRGFNICSGGHSEDGYHHYVGGAKEKCRFCRRNRVRCAACRGSFTQRCGGCRGRGQISFPCLACDEGRIPCPEPGRTEALRALAGEGSRPGCAWCAAPRLDAACRDCDGAGYQGCRSCRGVSRVLCGECNGSGKRLMVYPDGTTASSTKCPACRGKGGEKCRRCSRGKLSCDRCRGRGKGTWRADACPACGGNQKLATVEEIREHLHEPLAHADRDEVAQNQRMIERAVAFLLNSRRGRGFALREPSREDRAGTLERSTLFANANVLYALAKAGAPADDTRVATSLELLREMAAEAVEARKGEVQGVQAVALATRALVAYGEPVDGELVTGLVDLLVASQSSDGLWPDRIEKADEGSSLNALMALETLRLASMSGARVRTTTFRRALRAATTGLRNLDSDDTTWGWGPLGTRVASNVALVVIAKAGTLGDRAAGFDYTSLRPVQEGLAWLDRHLVIDRQPAFRRGAPFDAGDMGYSAWLFAIQRLAMLLRIEVLGGERWHVTGARHLRSVQFPDGRFEETGSFRANGPVRTTTSAVLFLLRATPPITNMATDSD